MESRYKYLLTQPMRELFISALRHVDPSKVGYYDFKNVLVRLKQSEITLTGKEISLLLQAVDLYISYAEAWSDDWLRVKEHADARKEFINLTRKKIASI